MLNLSLRIGHTRVSIEDVEDDLIDSLKAPLEQDYSSPHTNTSINLNNGCQISTILALKTMTSVTTRAMAVASRKVTVVVYLLRESVREKPSGTCIILTVRLAC